MCGSLPRHRLGAWRTLPWSAHHTIRGQVFPCNDRSDESLAAPARAHEQKGSPRVATVQALLCAYSRWAPQLLGSRWRRLRDLRQSQVFFSVFNTFPRVLQTSSSTFFASMTTATRAFFISGIFFDLTLFCAYSRRALQLSGPRWRLLRELREFQVFFSSLTLFRAYSRRAPQFLDLDDDGYASFANLRSFLYSNFMLHNTLLR